MTTIRDLRQQRDWTQFELAIKVGVHPQAVYFWESGRRMPQVPQLRKLGQLFGLCSDEITLVEPPADRQRATRRASRDRPSDDGPVEHQLRNTDADLDSV